MNSYPRISIITVTFQAAEVLEPTILSVIRQAYPHIEYIIVDGGSSDGTNALITKYRDYIATYISEADAGIYDAMNKGCKAATGDWVYFLGAGDILLNVLAKVAERLTDPTVIYYGDVYKLDELTVYDGRFSAFKLAVRNICHQSIFYPAAVFRHFTYNLNYPVQADHALNLRCYGQPGISFQYVPVLICAYEGDGISAQTLDLAFFRDKPSIIKENFSTLIYNYILLRNILGRLFNKNHWTRQKK
jgi:glycosyltransferase involved in cell wall biosynthesis